MEFETMNISITCTSAHFSACIKLVIYVFSVPLRVWGRTSQLWFQLSSQRLVVDYTLRNEFREDKFCLVTTTLSKDLGACAGACVLVHVRKIRDIY